MNVFDIPVKFFVREIKRSRGAKGELQVGEIVSAKFFGKRGRFKVTEIFGECLFATLED